LTFDGPTIFGKGTNQGAVIGSGANGGSLDPGDITFNSGEFSLIANARGALIGSGAGAASNPENGGNVYLNGGTFNLNVDYSGAAIGGAGYAYGNDKAGGRLYITGGSLRTFIDYNAVFPGDASGGLWDDYGVFDYGVNDAAITASKLDGDGQPVALLTFDTSMLSASAATFAVYADDQSVYTGGLHRYSFVNEDLDKAHQQGVASTMSNWRALDDPNLYLYLTASEHTLTVNGEGFIVAWDEEASLFIVTPANGGDDGTGTILDEETGKQVGRAASGDLDGDGYITAADVALAARAIIGLDNLSTAQIAALDLDKDGAITMADVTKIIRKAVGLE
jgi:hypothetical protein